MKKIICKLEKVFLDVKHSFQRMFRGYDDTAYWDLGYYVVNVALPVLKYYKSSKYIGCPYNDEKLSPLTEKEWRNTLDKMITACELYQKDNMCEISKEDFENNLKLQREGFTLMGKYLTALWS